MVLRGATSLLGALEGVGPENLDFFGNDVAPLKTITYRAIITTGTLIVKMVLLHNNRSWNTYVTKRSILFLNFCQVEL
jgi:hypothetical protein